MEKENFKGQDIRELHKKTYNVDHGIAFIKAKAIYDDERCKNSIDFINAAFSMCETPQELMVILLLYSDFPDGQVSMSYKVNEDLFDQTKNKIKVIYNRDNKFGWVDLREIKPSFDGHRQEVEDLVTWLKPLIPGGISLLDLLENLRYHKNLGNWETFAIVTLGWLNLAHAMNLELPHCTCRECRARGILYNRVTDALLN